MNDEELDNALRSLPTPPPRPGFWNVVDDAIADADARSDVGTVGEDSDGGDQPDRPPGDQESSDNVIALPTGTMEPRRHRRFGSQLTAVAASLVILAGFLWLLSSQPGSIDVADQPGALGEPGESPTPESSPLDIATVGRSVVEAHPDVTPSVEPVFADIDGDGAEDAAMVVSDRVSPLAVVTVDGATGDVSALQPLPGDELGTFAVRPGRIIVTTTTSETEYAVELVPVADSVVSLIVDRRTENRISDWNIQIAGAGNLGLTTEICDPDGDVVFQARTAAGTLVSINNSGQPYLLVDGPEGSFEGAITIETFEPFAAVGSFTAADDSAVGAITQITIGGPGC